MYSPFKCQFEDSRLGLSVSHDCAYNPEMFWEVWYSKNDIFSVKELYAFSKNLEPDLILQNEIQDIS